MQRIKKEDLYPVELEILKSIVATVGYTEEEKEFVYNNLFRDEDGVAYCPSKNRKKLLMICTD